MNAARRNFPDSWIINSCPRPISHPKEKGLLAAGRLVFSSHIFGPPNKNLMMKNTSLRPKDKDKSTGMRPLKEKEEK